jgi:hypothetical protein
MCIIQNVHTRYEHVNLETIEVVFNFVKLWQLFLVMVMVSCGMYTSSEQEIRWFLGLHIHILCVLVLFRFHNICLYHQISIHYCT